MHALDSYERTVAIHGGGTARHVSGLMLTVLGVAVVAGLGAGYWLGWQRPGASAEPTAAIEWNAVQAVPRRAPDAADVAWEKRAEEEDRPSTSSGRAETGAAQNSGTVTGDIYVIDGDTFSVGGERIRVAGMDAPETHAPRCAQEAQMGLAATERLRELLSSGTVTMSGSGREKYGRELRSVQVNGVDVAQAMISAGLASSYAGGKRQNWC